MVFSITTLPSITSNFTTENIGMPVSFSTNFLPSPFSITATAAFMSIFNSFNAFKVEINVPPVLTTSSIKRIFSPSFKSFIYNLEDP